MPALDPMEIFALWMFAHEEADELMKAAVDRGRAAAGEGMSGGPDAFTDGFMAMVAEEKERLKERLATGELAGPPDDTEETLAELRFEVGELRGRVEQMQATLDRIAGRLGAGAE